LHTAHKLVIEWGLLSVPVRLGVTLPSSGKTLFHQVHVDCGTQIKQTRHCPTCDVDVEFGDVGKGAEVPGTGIMVQVTRDELDALRDWEAGVFRILQFSPASAVDPLLFGTRYRVSPGHDAKGRPPAMRACALLMSAMVTAEAAAVGRYQDSLAMLEVAGGEFLLTKLAWPIALRPADADTVIDLDGAGPRPQELKMAVAMIREMSAPWRPEEHVDTYTESVYGLLRQKADGAVPAGDRPARRPTGGDMMAALTASLDAIKATRTAQPKTRASRARKAS
jgi:DNA end-binding protein Ku